MSECLKVFKMAIERVLKNVLIENSIVVKCCSHWIKTSWKIYIDKEYPETKVNFPQKFIETYKAEVKVIDTDNYFDFIG
jgi:hypothetical protein